MIADIGCAERGCACYDSRIDCGGVEMVKREWVGLTDMLVYDLADTYLYGVKNYGILSFYKAIEKALKEKNT